MLPDSTLRRFSSSPLLSLPFAHDSPAQGSRLPEIRSNQGTLTSVRNAIKLPWSLAAGIKALEAFGVSPNAVASNLGNPPLVHSSKRASGFHVSDLWSNRQQKELLRLLEIKQSQIAQRQRYQVLNYSHHTGTPRRASALHIFASQIVRASFLIISNGPGKEGSKGAESDVVKALISPRNRRVLSPKKRLHAVNSFIRRLEEVMHPPRAVQEMPRRRSLYQALRIPDSSSRSPKQAVNPFHPSNRDS